MSKIDAFALRGVVAAVASSPEPFPALDTGPRRAKPPSLDQVPPWHFIR
jgi:hypothetical protein